MESEMKDLFYSCEEIERAQLKALCSIAKSLKFLTEVLETSDLFVEYKRKKEIRSQSADWPSERIFD
jgi:hypothetical protein